ncbi:hypothetical protein NDU88_001279 [Pleurodeles waltl]|uniref:Uncharacterized protein n=1 Tax=Pleurodeles waltl TaxID=8319 RepID=A0AAV7MSA3_PLEWA|nr:hypothetical protein NDU88_001279 [Pleurodeles waltl]
MLIVVPLFSKTIAGFPKRAGLSWGRTIQVGAPPPTDQALSARAGPSGATARQLPALEEHEAQACSRQTDVPATVRAESGTESRFSLLADALSGRHSNMDAASLAGNPDIRAPETVKTVDGLRAARVVDERDAERHEGGTEEGPEKTEGRPTSREPRKLVVQDRRGTRRDVAQPESGTESRFSLLAAALSGRHSNMDAACLAGIPDIRAPETVKTDNGLRAVRVVDERDAKRHEGGTEEGPEKTEGRPTSREPRKPVVQDRIETGEEPEECELHHLPGGT